MIKIEKDLSLVPDSIQVPLAEYFPNGIPQPSQTTDRRRLELIANKGYINEQKFNDRYKQTDTQISLKKIYKNKCAFCEQKIEQSHIEHYRPKSVYYWLAYSWDNLLLACPTCNINKGIHFDLLGTKVAFQSTPENLKNINISSSGYDEVEEPKMVNPEVTDPKGKIQFLRNGMIESEDERFAYTIEKCEIDRKHLNDERRKILDIFQRDIKSAIIENSTIDDQEIEISSIVRKFIRDSKDEDLQFLGFRRYAISEWLRELIIDVKSN